MLLLIMVDPMHPTANGALATTERPTPQKSLYAHMPI